MVQLKGDEKARYVAAMFDRISSRYDLLNTVMSGGMHHLWRQRAAYLAAQEDQGEAPSTGSGQALDVATGTGDFALALARRLGIGRVVGLDFAPRMLPMARDKAQRRGLSHWVHWMLGDALALPFSDDHFLCATVGFGLRNFSDKEAALREMARVVIPGGRVVILDMVPLGDKGISHRLLRVYFRKVVPRLGTLLTGNKEAYTYLPDSVDSYLTAQQLAAIMEGAGLQNVHYQMMGLGTVALHVGEKAP
ncbi:MAG: bifunctional demethylmenaquinone methyltransferase/2-methoxy-6-polyprenyl-1,4-benzoquinol methylase UbiE [Chloroflexota bacterium]